MRRYKTKEDYFKGANPISIVYIASASDPKPSDDVVPMSSSHNPQSLPPPPHPSSTSSISTSTSTPTKSDQTSGRRVSTSSTPMTPASTFTIITHTSTLIHCKCSTGEVSGWVNAIYNGSCSLLRGLQVRDEKKLGVVGKDGGDDFWDDEEEGGYWKTPYGQAEIGVYR